MAPSPRILAVQANRLVPAAPPEEVFEPPAPAFLIGSSPLIIRLVKIVDGNLVQRAIECETDVNRGIVEAKAEDWSLIRTSIQFTKDGGQVADLGACIQKPTPAKETELTRGGSVGIAICIISPAPAWDAIVLAADGGLIDVHVKIELLLVDGAGKIHVMDTVNAMESVDPQTAV